MFTGLVEEVGQFQSMQRQSDSVRLNVLAPGIASDLQPGDSVAVNGCCLTVVSCQNALIQFDLLEETLRCTNLKSLPPAAEVNLERALHADGRLSGHFVQGHIDTVVSVRAISRQGADMRLDVEMPKEFARYIANKGSVALNGVSLTVAELSAQTFTVWVIPHTQQKTNLRKLSAGQEVNLECDILAKYAERILRAP